MFAKAFFPRAYFPGAFFPPQVAAGPVGVLTDYAVKVFTANAWDVTARADAQVSKKAYVANAQDIRVVD